MRCHSCHNDNPPGVSICEWCGTDLSTAKRKTQSERQSGGGGAAVVSGPGEKRRTMYEPSSQPARRPPADDFFGNPPPSRPPLRDPEDPTSRIDHLSRTDLDGATEQWARGRMKIKLRAAAEALDGGARRVVIAPSTVDQPFRRALDGHGRTAPRPLCSRLPARTIPRLSYN